MNGCRARREVTPWVLRHNTAFSLKMNIKLISVNTTRKRGHFSMEPKELIDELILDWKTKLRINSSQKITYLEDYKRCLSFELKREDPTKKLPEHWITSSPSFTFIHHNSFSHFLCYHPPLSEKSWYSRNSFYFTDYF